MEKKSAPSVTRVHNLHRIRTVVNHVKNLVDKGIQVDDLAIADHLIETHLSKATIDNFRDQIGRRARDHLETARYLGLVYRKKIGRRFAHFPTEWGRALSFYRINQECPSDTLEEALFVDRICRFKIANTSYLQEMGGTYATLRSRLCLGILSSLENSNGMNLFQIAAVVSDLSRGKVNQDKITKLVSKVLNTEWVTKYQRKLSTSNKRDIARDTMPFIDWCRQVGLLRVVEESGVYVITSRGKIVLDYYKKSVPVWWANLFEWGDFAAAAIILLNYLQMNKKTKMIKKLTMLEGRKGLFAVGNVGSMIHDVTGRTIKRICRDGYWFDFSFSYDVPPEKYELVQNQIKELLSGIKMKKSALSVIHETEWESVNKWDKEFKQEAEETSQVMSDKLQIKVVLPTASIQYHFQSDYEAATYVFLQQLQKEHFCVAKYQSQLTEYFDDDLHWKRMAANNPDLLVTNSFLSLVECKSVKEWGPKLVLNKKVVAELMLYG